MHNKCYYAIIHITKLTATENLIQKFIFNS